MKFLCARDTAGAISLSFLCNQLVEHCECAQELVDLRCELRHGVLGTLVRAPSVLQTLSELCAAVVEGHQVLRRAERTAGVGIRLH
jgi:hypothetical protein